MAMKRETLSMEKLEQLLRQTPERQVPADLHGKIMAEINTVRATETPPGRLKRWWQQNAVFGLYPLRWGISLAMAVTAFWLGTLVGGDDRDRIPAPQPQASAFAPFANSARANFLVGRGLLEAGEKSSALEFLQKAALQEPRSAEYGHWQGLAYWKLGDRDKERQSYEQAIARQPDYIPALLNLGHNLLEGGDYEKSLIHYEKVLQLNPYEQAALYNRALIYHQLQDQVKEREAFSRYLASYRSDKWAYRAVTHLQHLGMFDYRVCLIGNRKIVINQQVLLGPALPARQLELERIAGWLDKTTDVELHLVVYCSNDREQGKAIAEELRQQLSAVLITKAGIPIRISWFDEPAMVRTEDGIEHELTRGLLFFTQSISTKGSNV
jgi:tetratricopeptide (TPR) repeat protein